MTITIQALGLSVYRLGTPTRSTRSYGRTDGRTDEESGCVTDKSFSFVTPAQTYGFSSFNDKRALRAAAMEASA